ncbi:hypothetical protein JCM3766R1_005213 [Sporobolomyces carnicolor]
MYVFKAGPDRLELGREREPRYFPSVTQVDLHLPGIGGNHSSNSHPGSFQFQDTGLPSWDPRLGDPSYHRDDSFNDAFYPWSSDTT